MNQATLTSCWGYYWILNIGLSLSHFSQLSKAFIILSTCVSLTYSPFINICHYILLLKMYWNSFCIVNRPSLFLFYQCKINYCFISPTQKVIFSFLLSSTKRLRETYNSSHKIQVAYILQNLTDLQQTLNEQDQTY